MSSKITIIGAGSVGSTIAYTLSSQDIASEIVLIDINKKKAEGEVLDIIQGTCFRDPISTLPETTKMLGILTSLSSHPVLPVNQDRQDLNLHRQM
ncbi:MAG: lactate/malate family dehydrogenase [Blautia wexlerae]